MKERMCNLMEPCETPEAPLCPIQIETIKHGIWYPGEPVCKSKRFSHLPWLEKQRKIARLKLPDDVGFFTVRMFDQIHTITRDIKGADPDEPDAELKWLESKEEKKAARRRTRRSAGGRNDVEDGPVRKDMLF
jgi:hypothetical protein